MNEINEIVKTALDNLNNKNKLITPNNYEKEFFSLFSKTDLILDEYAEFEEIIDILNQEEKNILKKENITSFKELAVLLSNRVNENDIKQFLKQLSFLMSPSLNNENTKNDIIKICQEIAKKPNTLIDNETKRKLRKLTNDRIEKDKKLFTDKTTDVKKLIDFLGDYFKKIASKNSDSLNEVFIIKDEIKNLKLSNSSKNDFETLQNKLLEVVEKFENVLNDNSEVITTSQETTSILYEQIEELQVCLSKAEEEKSIDFLTGVLTRRAFDAETARIESDFSAYKSSYSIIFYDIDHFKNINDSYGHACGDSILKTFASILSKLTRDEDIVVRYGGEEFVAMVHYKEKSEVIEYIKRAKNIITNNKFVYNDLKLNIAFCAGVTFRNNYDSFEDALIKADELLYEAKHSGRNKIIFDSGEIF